TIGVVANLAVVPLAGLATVVGLVGVAAAALSPLVGGWLFAATWPVLLHLRAPGAIAIVAYAGALALGLLAWHARATHLRLARRLGFVAGALALTSALLTLWPALRPADG